MSRCRCCDTEIHASGGKVFCNDICKAIFTQIKETIKTQRKGFYMEMKLKCKRCKQATAGKDYCENCIMRIAEEKQKRKDTDHYRPCEDCKVEMKNPAPNRRRCKTCGIKAARIKQAAHDVKRKAKRDAVRANNPNKRQRAGDKTDVHKSTINPYFLAPQGSKRRTG